MELARDWDTHCIERGSDGWVEYDDARVGPLDGDPLEREEFLCGGYIFFYHRR